MHGQVLVVGTIFVRSCQNLPPCPAEPAPVGSKDEFAAGQGCAQQEWGELPCDNRFKKKKKSCFTDVIVDREEQDDSMKEEQLCRHSGQCRRRGGKCWVLADNGTKMRPEVLRGFCQLQLFFIT